MSEELDAKSAQVAGSYVRNCVVCMREPGQALFTANAAGELVATLDGYVICPREKLQEIASALRVDADPSTLAV